MKAINKKDRILTVILVFTVLVIWGNSMMTPDLSWRLSEWVRGLLGMVFSDVTSGASGHNWAALVRKLAHFFEFFLFGALLRLRFRKLPAFWLSVLLGILAALVDESIQFFSGRTSSVFDVWLDFTGAMSGALMVEIPEGVKKLIRKKTVEEKKGTDKDETTQ